MKPDDAALAEIADGLLWRIARAFKDVPRPVITHSVAGGYNEERVWSMERDLELAAQDPEQTWEAVTDEAIEQCWFYFTHADAEGWLFYLPAHMRHRLRDPSQAGSYSAVVDACHQADRKGRRTDKLKLLNAEQLACVDEFLAFVDLAGEYQNPVFWERWADAKAQKKGGLPN